MTEFRENIKAKSVWLRGFFILIFGVLWAIAEILLVAVVILQFFTILFTAKRNESLIQFGAKISDYFHDVALYVTYNSDQKPFPFSDSGHSSKDDELQIEEESKQKEAG